MDHSHFQRGTKRKMKEPPRITAAMCISLCHKIAEHSRLGRAACLSRQRERLRGRSRSWLTSPLPLPLRACEPENTRPDPRLSGVLTPPRSLGQQHTHGQTLVRKRRGISTGRHPFQPARLQIGTAAPLQLPNPLATPGSRPSAGPGFVFTCPPLFGRKGLLESAQVADPSLVDVAFLVTACYLILAR